MIKKGDFIELDYTARLKDENLVFDTTSAQVAKEAGSFSSKFHYAPVVICVGEHHLIPGLDDSLIGKNTGSYNIEIPAEKGFGKKQAGLLKLIPLRLFKNDKVDPYPGLEVNVDDQVGIVKSVSGGRVIVDFNHPLSGKDLLYDVEIRRMVTDPVEMIRALLDLIRLPHVAIDVMDTKAEVHIKMKLPDEVTAQLSEDIKRMTGLREIAFKVVEQEAKAAPKKAHEHKHGENGQDHGKEGHSHKGHDNHAHKHD